MPARTDVAATGGPGGLAGSPFLPTAQRVAADPSWTYLGWPTRHGVLHDGPARLRALLGAC